MLAPDSEVREVKLLRWQTGSTEWVADAIAAEEPLQIRLSGPDQTPVDWMVTLRTPGDDDALVTGLLFAEGIIRSLQDVRSLRAAGFDGVGNISIIEANLTFSPDQVAIRRHVAHASCGACGKSSLSQLAIPQSRPLQPEFTIEETAILRALERLSQAQAGFQRTGGLHAAAWFDQSGRLLELCEDVGRHNAFDKMVGLAMRAGGVPLSEGFVVLSGRAGYELIQKAAQAGVAIVCAIGAPSSLAIEFAHAAQMTLIGFARPDRMNVYCHAERLKFLGRGMG